MYHGTYCLYQYVSVCTGMYWFVLVYIHKNIFPVRRARAYLDFLSMDGANVVGVTQPQPSNTSSASTRGQVLPWAALTQLTQMAGVEAMCMSLL